MAKYIDADRLKAELDEHYRNYQSKYMETRTPYTQGLIDALDLAEQVIDSFLQEQPEKPVPNDLAEEVKRYYSDNFAYLSSDQPTLSILTNFARHFYDLGCRRTAEKYDEIEYNRQRAEESEKPMNLEEEINRYLREECSDDDEPGIHEIAEHFAKWGAEHLASTGKTSPKDLEEAADNHISKVVDAAGHPGWDWTTQDIADAFIAGAKWQERKDEKEQADLFTIVALDAAQRAKDQMMKEAVEGEVCGRVYDHINVRFADGVCKFLEPKNISHIPADVSKYKVGDKVRIIVCKNED